MLQLNLKHVAFFPGAVSCGEASLRRCVQMQGTRVSLMSEEWTLSGLSCCSNHMIPSAAAIRLSRMIWGSKVREGRFPLCAASAALRSILEILNCNWVNEHMTQNIKLFFFLQNILCPSAFAPAGYNHQPVTAKGCLPLQTTSLLLGTVQTLRLAPLPCITLSSDRTCRPCRALQANSGYVNKTLSNTQKCTISDHNNNTSTG